MQTILQTPKKEPFHRCARAAMAFPWMLVPLALLVLCYPLSGFFPWLAAALLALLCCAGSLSALASAYVFLFLFDNMLPFPLLGGSLARVLQLGILVRAGIACARNRAWPDRFTCLAAFFAAATCAVSFFLKGPVGDSLSFGVNLLVLLSLRLAARGEWPPQDRDRAMAALVSSLLYTYVASALTAVCFGLLHYRFYVLGEGAAVSVRFLGTHEPNFMAMFLDIALLCWLALPYRVTDKKAQRLLDAAVIGILLGALLLTGSMTGMGIAACMTLICACMLCNPRAQGEEKALRRQRWKALALRLVCGGAIGVVFAVGSAAWVRAHPIKISEIYALEAATGVAEADTPIYIAQEEYRALRAQGDPVAPHLLTKAQWAAYLEAHGLQLPLFSLEEVQPYLGDGLAAALRRVPVLGERLYMMLGYARCYGLDAATSGRYGLIAEKLRDFSALPLWQKLFGRGPDPELTYFPLFQTFGYSHNSYLDLLTCFGLLGGAGLLWWFARTAKRGGFWGCTWDRSIKANEPERGGYRLHVALTLARIALLLHAATLSMYLNRVFLFFFLG